MGTRSGLTGAFGNDSSQIDYERIANGLGWFSLGLGAAEIAAPGMIANLIGVRDETKNRMLLRSPLYGMREVAAGVGILTQPRPAGWLWGRVAGDLLDLSSLVSALGSRENERKRLTGALVAVLGVTALDYMCARQLSQAGDDTTEAGNRRSTAKRARSAQTVKSTWVNRSPEEAYNFWHNFENLPRFMHYLESVQSLGEGRSRWRVQTPVGKTFEWEARIEQDQPNRLIAWTSVEGSEISNSGTVFFEPGPGGRGTMIRVDLAYDPPGGALGAGLSKLMGKAASELLAEDLRAFKQVIETGEVIQSDASIHPGMHPAHPPREQRGIPSSEPVHV